VPPVEAAEVHVQTEDPVILVSSDSGSSWKRKMRILAEEAETAEIIKDSLQGLVPIY